MRTEFSPARLADPATASSEAVIRKCVHCGFCLATCPTYVLLGDELDSPRGRIYLIKEMLEKEQQPTAEVVKHIDRCLSCHSCMTTCPSGVNYMHLVDHARAYIDARYRRPLLERVYRGVLSAILPHRTRFRVAIAFADVGRPFERLFGRIPAFRPLAAMLRLAPRKRSNGLQTVGTLAQGAKRGRVAVLQGCAEPLLRPEIRAATMRLLNRAGYDAVLARGEGCCGALVHHMGREAAALAAARRNVDAWSAEIAAGGLDAILVTASGCGTTIKDYGFMLRNDAAYAEQAARVSALARDVSEFFDEVGLPPVVRPGDLVVAYQAACSLQHGQRVVAAPLRLLAAAGYTVRQPAEAHLCCGSAGTYNILQPEIASALGDRKVANLEALAPAVIATGNIGCATQIATRTDIPVLHIVELLDRATGG